MEKGGTILKNKKKLFNAALATAMAAGAVVAVAPTATEAATTKFKDVDTNNSHYNTIMNLVERGYIKGYEDQTFKPGQALTRAHAALILANVLGLDTKNVTDPKFKDVPKSHPYYGAIAALANAGYIKGFTDGTYGMNKTLTRGQMAVILTHAFELKAGTTTLPFKDVPNNHEYKDYISALFTNNVTAGTTATTFSPTAAVTRGQFATFVVKGEIAAPEKVVSIKDGQLTTNKGTYAIEGDLAKVFNASNAAALKGAKVDFKFAGQTAAVASTNTVAATETTTKKIVGIASLTIVAGNATFNADGYSISELTVNGNNVEVKNVVADKLVIDADVTVKLTGVQAKEIEATPNTKLTLDATSKIDKLVLPKGVDIKTVITNYDQVKDAITTIVEVDESGNETPVDPTTPAPGSGGGGVSTTNKALDAKTDATTLVNALVTGITSTYATYLEPVVVKEPSNKNSSSTVESSGQATIVDFKDSQSGTYLATIKNSVDRTTLKNSVLNQVAPIILGLNSTSIDNIDSVYVGNVKLNTVNITSTNYFDQLSAVLNTNTVADTLSNITGLTEAVASNLTVAGYFAGNFAKSGVIKITFDDQSTLEYTVTLQQ